MFTRLTFADVLKEERLREMNDCHNPSGPAGGQFCSKGGRAATGRRAEVSADWRKAMTDAGLRTDRPGKLPKAKRTTASDYLNELMDYGGVQTRRGDVIADLRRSGLGQSEIDRYMQGAAARQPSPYSSEEQAQQSPTFKGTKLGLQLASAVTDYDRRQEKRRSRSYYNPYALPQYLAAATRVQDAVAKGTPLEKALTDNFEGRLLAHVRKWLVKRSV